MPRPILDDLQLPAWTPYTPVLTAATTDPTLGTGAEQSGAYIRLGSTVFFRARIAFGTSGAAAGSGVYSVSLPVAAKTGGIVGVGYLYDSSGNDVRIAHLTVDPGQLDKAYPRLGAGTGYSTGSATPWAWAASDSINYTGSYEAA